jgi:CheY-like chemotaxis protein
VVDDNKDAAETLMLLTSMWGHDVRMATDGPAALEEAREFQPSVVLLDIGMPGMDGYEVARRLRAESSPGGPTMRIIALTGFGAEDARRQIRAAGFDAHLIKPVEPAALEQLLRSPA